MFLFDTNTRESFQNSKPKKSRSKRSIHKAAAKAAAKAKKVQQDDMDALQITFYEIESWIEKASPVLAKMTKELDKASRHFDKKMRLSPPPEEELPEPFIPTTLNEISKRSLQQDDDDVSSMQWSLSFRPGNSMRLETNIKSVEQLIEAVQKIRLISETDTTTTTIVLPPEEYDELDYASSSSSTTSSTAVVDPSIEYWNLAMYRRPNNTCFQKYKHNDMNLGRLTQDVSPTVLSYICQTYWDCLYPKFSADWSTFWNRSGGERNQVCIDSGLAMVFLHVIRHNKNACANARDIAYYYYDRAREHLEDYFDSPDEATIEALLNLGMFCVLCKRDSQARIYMGLAYRMMHQLNIYSLPPSINRLQRKKYLKMHMVLYYNDLMMSIYSGEPTLLDDIANDINFYDILTLNKQLVEHEEANYNEETIAKESFFAYTLELAKIGKRIQHMTREYQGQQYHHSGTLPLRWVKKVQALEIDLATWFDRLPCMYRVDPQPNQPQQPQPHQHDHLVDAYRLREQSALLLMLQYQMQWIKLHKTFLSPNINQFTHDDDDDDVSLSCPSPLATTPYRTNRSYRICTDAANRIVIMSELITSKFDWCVCQQFISCIYQASTVFCKSVIHKDASMKASKAMIHRITAVLDASKINYEGLPDDLTACLNDFLAENNDFLAVSSDVYQYLIDKDGEMERHAVVYHDGMFNSPHMYKQCMKQQWVTKPPLTTLNRGPPSEAMFSIKIQNPGVVPMDLEPSNRNWRCKFSSSNISHVM